MQISSPSPELSWERDFLSASANWNDSVLKLSSPCLRCWSLHVFFCWLDDWPTWKSCADWNGCHGFQYSEYLQCSLYNPVALPYAFPPAMSTPTTCIRAFIFVRSGVHVRSGFWGSIVSLSGVSSGGGAPGTLSMVRSLVDKLLDGHSGAPSEVKQSLLIVDPSLPKVVLAMCPGNQPAVMVWTVNSVWFSSRPIQQPNPHFLRRVVAMTRHKPGVFWPGWTWTTVPF